MRLFAITLLVAQIAVSVVLVGWVLANAGLLGHPLVILAIAVAVLAFLGSALRRWIAGKPAPHRTLKDVNS